MQTKLREELLTVNFDTPDMDEIKSLTYLDWVVKEVMRLHSPIPSLTRIAAKDDVIPAETGNIRYKFVSNRE